MEREIFASDEELIIYAISDADRNNYVELHRQLNGEKSLYLNPIAKDMMWEQTLKGNDKIFSLFSVEGDYCGSIELQQLECSTPEIGIDLLESKRNQGIAVKAIRLFAKKIYAVKYIEYFLIRISSNNLHSQHIFEKMGAIKIGEEETSFSRFVKVFGNMLGKEGQDLEKFKYLFHEEDNEVIYRYRLNPNIFNED